MTTTADLLDHVNPGEVTLRDVLTAITTQAPSGNAAAGTANNIIQFAIGAQGSVQTIQVGSGNVAGPLPALNQQAFIDGWSQGGPNYSGPPLIVLNGVRAGLGANGLQLDAGSNSSVVRGLVIQAFSNNGIEVRGAGDALIVGNFIGTDATGTAPLGNGSDGVLLTAGARGNTVGGVGGGAGNVISANGNAGLLLGNGVHLTGPGTTGNSVLGNLIGTDRTGTVALGNVIDGVRIDGGASANTIGGTAAGAGNIICGSLNIAGAGAGGQAAVFALGSGTISGNIARFDVAIKYLDAPPFEMFYLGIDIRASSAALAPVNPGTGLRDFSAFGFIRSSTFGPGWGPVDNAFPGEFLFHTPPSTGQEAARSLPPNATYLAGTLTYDLARFGIAPSAGLTISIAGADTAIGAQVPGNTPSFTFVNPTFAADSQPLVSGEASAGVAIKGAGTNDNVVQGNIIGTDARGNANLGHLSKGVLIDSGAMDNIVGGTVTGAANVIAGNDFGIALSGNGTTGNVLQGNRIGTNGLGTNLGNFVAGVFLEKGASANTVGGTTAGSGNSIAFNGKGVVIGNSPADTTTTQDSVLGNSIFANTGSAIDLGDQGPTANGANPRPAPNDGQNNPLIDALTLHTVSGHLTSVPSSTFRIEVFANPVGTAATQGQVFLGFTNATTDVAGTVNFEVPVATIPLGTVVTATATNLTSGNTSESSPGGTQLLVFSNPVVVSTPTAQVVTLSAQLFSGTTPVAGRVIDFSITGLVRPVPAVTSASGIATINLTLPVDAPPGQYTVIAAFLGGGEIPGTTGLGFLTIAPPLVGRTGRRWAR